VLQSGRRGTAFLAVAWVAGLAGLTAAGLWLGGYPGAVLLPVATAVFVLAGRRGGAVGRVLSSRWGPAAALLMAAAGTTAGSLTLDGSTLATALTNTGPQVLCLLVLARLAAGLVTSDYARDGDPVPAD